ncbi:MAG: type II toxin-antitoxin system HicA family toxin [Methanosarcinales archaeon]
MTKLPIVSGKKVVKCLTKVGFYIRRQTGSHIILRRDHPDFAQVVVPNHKRIDPGTLLSILKGADLTKKDFMDLLKK